MAKGGARAISGRPPDPAALRRDRGNEASWTTLPASREGKAPDWPLEESSPRELMLWDREWRRPQAVMWERNGQELEVALYVRALVAAEKTDASVATRTLVRQQQEALGLSLPGLLRNRWRIPAMEAAKGSSAQPRARSGLRVVAGGSG